ncbi:ATP-binding protein [Aliiglaciecola lipolytica]|uniref:ATP-binding protein n=1 Tax=Aliiglaciecola lipolytica TaxID=477689 RepID=UPI001C088CD4|nr:ATP-binding protein [Aliiglaciecola lipolytica]MBU2878854.1 response regulator [Aliiglaciecola lipolytica]
MSIKPRLPKIKSWYGGKNLFIPTFFLFVSIISIAIIIFETQINTTIMALVEENQRVTNSRIDTQVQQSLSKYRNDLRFLFGTPPIEGFANTMVQDSEVDGSTHEQWKQRLETIFVAFVENNSEYEQMRFIGIGNEGKELVRVERSGGGIKVVGDAHLQNKSERDYYQQSIKLSAGQIYLSEISLNREFGEIEFPYRPMLRLSIPVFNNQIERLGFLILNINASELLNSIQGLVDKPNQLILTDSNGFFLVHPNPELMYSKDLNPEASWDSYYNQKLDLGSQIDITRVKHYPTGEFYSSAKKLIISGDFNDGFLLSHILTPEAVISDLAMQRRTNVYAILFVVFIVIVIVLAVFQRGLRRSQELAEARAESEAIVNGSQDAIFGLTTDGRISSWNRAAKALFGLDFEQVEGRRVVELSLFPEVNFDELIHKLASGVSQQSLETCLQQDQNIKLLVSLSAILQDGVTFSGVAVITRDITSLKKADEKIRKVNAELEVKVARRTAQLEKASDVKSAFISNISHEMRTPLNGIIGTLNLIKKEPLSEQQLQYLDMTEVSVNSLSVLINDILDLSKIEAGKLDLDYKAFKPGKLIESLCGSMAVKAQEKGLEFILDSIDIKCESIISDPHRYSQILTNILNNAIKFTNQGHILVNAYSEQLDDNHCSLHFAVTDTGIGIAEENQKRLFSAFSQEDSAIASKYGGTGLGLSICKQLSKLLNGQVTFKSEKGKGSTFHFQVHIPNVNVTFKRPEKHLSGKLVTILVANQQLHQSLCNMVVKLGAKVMPDNEITGYLESNTELPAKLPDIFIVDQLDPRALLLEHCWDAIEYANNSSAKVAMLYNTRDAKTMFKRLKPIYISKPVSISEFLLKYTDKKQTLADANAEQNKPKITDVDLPVDSKLTGARVLVVDDNDINVEVAIGILKPTSVETVRAANGQQAIDKLLASAASGEIIHCVLMDCQMPILNGYEATAQIRNGEAGQLYIDVPIIAMTANAMLGERQKCLEAGMNDYVTKPISAEKLITKLTKWVLSVFKPKVKIINDSGDTEQSIAQAITSCVVWDKQGALTRLMNNQNLLNKICNIFLQNTGDKIAKLRGSVQSQSLEEICQLSHSLKGVCGDIGAMQLHETFGNIEIEAHKPNIAAIESLLVTMEQQYDTLVNLLEKHIEAAD